MTRDAYHMNANTVAARWINSAGERLVIESTVSGFNVWLGHPSNVQGIFATRCEAFRCYWSFQ